MGKSAPGNLKAMAAAGALWPQLQAAVQRIEALPLTGAPKAQTEQHRSLEALRLALPMGNSVGCSYSQCVDVPAVGLLR